MSGRDRDERASGHANGCAWYRRAHVRSWQIGYRGLVSDEILDGLSVADRAATWQTVLQRSVEEAFTVVAERDGRVVGFCSMIAPSRDDDAGAETCEAAAIYVEPELWRMGVGGALLVAALRELDGSWDEVTLWVFADNARALAFYRRFGFHADGARTWHEPSGQEEIRLRTSIASRSRPVQK